MPPIWVTSGHPETLGRAIRDNHNLFVTALLNGLDAVKALRERLEGIAAKEGRSIDNTRFGFLRCGYASDNESEIMSYLDNARFQRRVSESLKFRRAQSEGKVGSGVDPEAWLVNTGTLILATLSLIDAPRTGGHPEADRVVREMARMIRTSLMAPSS